LSCWQHVLAHWVACLLLLRSQHQLIFLLHLLWMSNLILKRYKIEHPNYSNMAQHHVNLNATQTHTRWILDHCLILTTCSSTAKGSLQFQLWSLFISANTAAKNIPIVAWSC
jgi:hypothetical protein